MQSLLRIVVIVALLALSGCGGTTPSPDSGQATAPPTAAAPPPTSGSPTQAALAPTVTFESVTEEPINLEPTTAAVKASGSVAWRDQVLRNDSVTVQASGLPAPAAGQVYAAWLVGGESSLPLGELALSGDAASLTYVSPTQENLLAAYDQVYIGQVPAAASAEVQNVVLGGTLPAQALLHTRHVLVSFPETPEKVGFALGLRQESDELLRHAQFLKDAADQQDFALVQVHAEHIINIIDGSKASDYNGDGKLQNPGDGFGLLENGEQAGYVKGMIDHAQLAAGTPDATDAIKLHAGHVQIAGENVRGRVEEIRGLAKQIIEAGSLDETTQMVLGILALAQQSIQGVDANLDEQIGPIAGEGGVLTAYQHAQLMAGLPLAPAANEVQAPPVAEAPPTPTPPAGGSQAIAIGDNTFAPAEITVAIGTSVTWTHGGKRPHTVTADDGSFNSGTLQNGATFTQTFDKPGIYQYFCELHGAAGKQGMSGVIIVGDGATSSQATPAATAPAATAAPAEAAVSMVDFNFEPAEIRVKVGTSVVWSNDGAKSHSAHAVDGSFDTGLFAPGETRRVTFANAGTFAYYCELHGSPDGANGMVGTVIVEP
jgi:plastocyanin